MFQNSNHLIWCYTACVAQCAYICQSNLRDHLLLRTPNKPCVWVLTCSPRQMEMRPSDWLNFNYARKYKLEGDGSRIGRVKSLCGYSQSAGKLSTHDHQPQPEFHQPGDGKAYQSRGKLLNAGENCVQKMDRTSVDLGPSYLDEFMWRVRFGKTLKLAYLYMMTHNAERYTC